MGRAVRAEAFSLHKGTAHRQRKAPVMNQIYTEGLAQALFEEAGDALFLFEPESDRLVDVNRTAERLTGMSHTELLALSAMYLFRFGGRGG